MVARSSVQVLLHHYRELDRLRQKWQARGLDKQARGIDTQARGIDKQARGLDKQASTSSELSDPSHQQRPCSVLSQQEGCPQHKSLVQLCKGNWQSPRGASRHQRSSAEGDSPPRRCCSPRCRVARGTITQTGNTGAVHTDAASHS